MRERLRATDSPESEVGVLAELLAEDLTSWPEDAWVAFDDYQYATERPAAEEFVALLLQRAPVRMILASRVRPAWATARRVLYGELLELTQVELSMTEPEASAVLEHPADVLLERAQGWPAVIGLAAVTDTDPLPAVDLPPRLFAYFAEEMYRALSPELRDALLKLALAETLGAEVCRLLLGPATVSLIERGVDAGFLIRASNRELSLHPLLRAFLRTRLQEGELPHVEQTERELGTFYLRSGRWDDAFALATQLSHPDSLHALLETALEALLSGGRIATLERWVDYATRHSVSGPLVQLAKAHVDARAGRFDRAELLAVEAAQGLERRGDFLANALSVASQAAYFAERQSVALAYLDRARAVTSSSDQLQEILWRAVCVTVDTDTAQADRFLDEYKSIEDHRPEHVLRASYGTVAVATHAGQLNAVVDRALSLLEFLSETSDPGVRTGYLGAVTTGLVQLGRYREAADVSRICIEEASASHLGFVLPQSYFLAAEAAYGLRRFRQAHGLMGLSLGAVRSTRDLHIEVNNVITGARLFLAEGAPREAVRLTSAALAATISPTTAGELDAIRALALTCIGRFADALSAVSAGERKSESKLVHTVTMWVRALVALKRDDSDVAGAIGGAARRMMDSGHVHGFVMAYRAEPLLLSAVRPYVSDSELLRIVERANDRLLAGKAGLPVARSRSKESDGLTRREREVYELLSQGRSNREIARALFISETTAKVHVRHIFEKLGVRTRVEAANKAAEIL
jgi:ATP/maltotriose-dependent transcriptional regulator MalT